MRVSPERNLRTGGLPTGDRMAKAERGFRSAGGWKRRSADGSGEAKREAEAKVEEWVETEGDSRPNPSVGVCGTGGRRPGGGGAGGVGWVCVRRQPHSQTRAGVRRRDGNGRMRGFRFSNKAWFSFKNSWGLGPVAFSFLFGK